MNLRISSEVMIAWLLFVVAIITLLSLHLGFQHNLNKFTVAVNTGLVECRTEAADSSYGHTRWLTPELCEVIALAAIEND